MRGWTGAETELRSDGHGRVGSNRVAGVAAH